MMNIKTIPYLFLLSMFSIGSAQAVVPDAFDDEFGIPTNRLLVVESAGVMENDELGGENAIDSGVTVTIKDGTGPTKGTMTCPGTSLQLCADGSFEYTPNEDPDSGLVFDGSDSFQYLATDPDNINHTATATVTLSACSTGAVSTCWHEAAFRARISGYTDIFREGFEGPVWDSVRVVADPTPSDGISNKGVTWKTNFAATNGIQAGSGAEKNGFYGGFDPVHGDPAIPVPPWDITLGPYGALCIDVPEPIPEACFHHDGLSGSGTGLIAVGGYFKDVGGTLGNISVILDTDPVLNIGKKPKMKKTGVKRKWKLGKSGKKVGKRKLFFFFNIL